LGKADEQKGTAKNFELNIEFNFKIISAMGFWIKTRKRRKVSQPTSLHKNKRNVE